LAEQGLGEPDTLTIPFREGTDVTMRHMLKRALAEHALNLVALVRRRVAFDPDTKVQEGAHGHIGVEHDVFW